MTNFVKTFGETNGDTTPGMLEKANCDKTPAGPNGDKTPRVDCGDQTPGENNGDQQTDPASKVGTQRQRTRSTNKTRANATK